jgi:hypothetical protein
MRPSLGEHWPAAALAAATLLIVSPLWLAQVPAMPDYPAHLASFHLIGGLANDPVIAQYWRIEWGLIPNLASEITVPLLAKLCGYRIATKLFLTAATLFWAVGPALVQRALYGRITVTALVGALFAYNANFMWGFFNYHFASGLALVAFAGWIASAGWPQWRRAVVLTLALLAIYFSHVFAAALLLLLVGCYEAQAWLAAKPLSLKGAIARLWPIAAAMVPVAILFLFFKPAGVDGRVAFNLLDSWLDRIEAMLDLYFDQTHYALLVALLGAVVAGLRTGRLVLHRRMWLVLAALLFLTIFAPEEAMGGWGVDLRIPPVFCALFFASSELRLERRWLMATAALLLVVIGFDAAALAGNWRYYDRRYDEFRAADAVIPEGSRIVTVLDGDAIGWASDQPYWHMAEFAIIDRKVFTPLLFATKGQHAVRLQPSVAPFAAQSARQGSPPDISELEDLSNGLVDGDTDIAFVFPYLMRFQCHYDYAVVIHLNGHRSPVPSMLHLVHAGSFFAIYAIEHRGCPKT